MDTKSQEWIEQTEAKIREAFDLFDKDKNDAIIQEEVGTVMRALGAYPTERDLVLNILPAMQDDEPTGFVSYKKFEKKMLQILATKECDPDSGDLLLQAFRTIDADNTGYVSAELMEELLTGKGTPFRPKELESFLMVAKDPETGNIYYEDYVALLMKREKSAAV
jgi:Ca2+-binding EF-hand superfamily protein